MEASSSSGRLPRELVDDKYLWFSDANCMKDRLAFAGKGGPKAKAPEPEPTEFAPSGWDKYFFFSVPPGTGGIHVTSKKGRARPAMQGPQTFQMEAFSAEQLEAARTRAEAQGGRTIYSESYSQIPRSTTHLHGPIDERVESQALTRALASGSRQRSGPLARAASESLLSGSPGERQRSAVEILAGPRLAARSGPHWPPPGPERPDPIKTRENLMQRAPRNIVDLHSRDRQGPKAWLYTVTNH